MSRRINMYEKKLLYQMNHENKQLTIVGLSPFSPSPSPLPSNEEEKRLCGVEPSIWAGLILAVRVADSTTPCSQWRGWR